jgi:hypothetical protein
MSKPSILYRLLKSVKLTPQCWLWLGTKDKHGYGRLSVNKSPKLVSRLSWEIFVGPIPMNLLVCHKCDNPQCINPGHLFLGTHLDNMRDMIKKGRANHSNNIKGEKHFKAKLTNVDVQAIRQRYKIGDITQEILSKQYQVCKSTIGKILTNKNWKSVKETNVCHM